MVQRLFIKYKSIKRGAKMRYEKLKLSVVFLLRLGLTEIQAQSSVNTDGSNASDKIIKN